MRTPRFEALRRILDRILEKDSRPIVCYSGVWSIASAFEGERRDLVEACKAELLAAVGSRTLLMPTYTSGFKNGALNLDQAPGMTGILNEAIRSMPQSMRTASAFFSFTAFGPQAADVAALRPKDAWGDGSLFEWIEKQNAQILLIGVPLVMCSFLHRVEWLGAVPYRYVKEFSGEVTIRGRKENLTERLFVRSLDPVAENIWPGAEKLLFAHGYKTALLGRGIVASVSAQNLVNVLLQEIRANPYAFVKNPDLLRAQFENKPQAVS